LLVPALALVSLAALAFGCVQNDDEGDATPTVPATGGEATPTANGESPTATDGVPPDIHQEDFGQQQGLQDFLTSSGGELLLETITYADLTGDSAEEAVVPVSSGGEGGDIAVFVYGYVDGAITELLRALPEEASNIVAGVENGQLLTTEPVYGPGDPLCCPSQLRHRSYRWDGSALIMDSEAVEALATPTP
jgi:hypothetical protein